MATPNLEGRTLVSLAHVYARALETVERDPPISAEDARQTKLRYAACALACLRRAEIASRAQIRPEVSTSAVRRGESQSSRTASADERGRFAQDCVEVAQRLLAGDCESDAETCLQFAEAIVPPADDSALAIAVKRLRAEFCRRRAQFEIAQGKLDSALERINPGIALLDALRARDPTGAVAGELQVLLRDKAWWLSRAGRTDEAFAAWDRAVSNATGPDRDFCRCERALERALAGDHLAAIAEADELSSMTDLPGHLLVHLARVHARSIEAVDRHSALSSEEGVALKTRFAGRAIACLSRAEADWLTTPGRLDEVDADAAFAALRGSDSFRAWRQAFKQPNAD
jgi:hypothetical protein